MSLLRRGAMSLAGTSRGVTAALGDWAPASRLFAKGAAKGDGGSKEEMLLEMLRPQATPPKYTPPKHTPEDAKRAKDYSRLKMNEHRRFQGDLSKKLKLMQAAVAALPEELREAALEPDMAPIPAKRQIPLATPNIEGWYEGKQKEAEAATGLGGAKRR